MSAGESSWGKAFGYGGRFAIYAILWVIIGGFLIWNGIASLEASEHASWDYDKARLEANGIFSLVAGLLIFMIGVAASFFKVMLELIRDLSPKPTPPPQQA